MIISGSALIAGVIGYPVKHSLSPKLHNFWIKRYNFDAVYIPLQVSPDNIKHVVKSLPYMGIVGCNVTVPHKESVMDLMDDITPIAKRIGAVNTITINNEGKLCGTNTDAYGFIENIKNNQPDFNFSAGKSVVLGAGGAARAICAALLDEGVPEITIVNRTIKKAEEIKQHLGGNIKVKQWDDRNIILENANLLVNTTTLGMSGKSVLDINLDLLPDSALVTDIIYVPLETPLLMQAKKRGNKILNGLGMLLYQAVPGFESWFGMKAEINEELYEYILSC